MGLRRQSRETTLKILYLMDVAGLNPDESFSAITRENKFSQEFIDFVELLLEGTIKNKTEIDEIITKYVENWELTRLNIVDRNILRIGTFELLKTPDTPVNVIINEAIEIAKKYSTSDSGGFVNGVLDKIKGVRS